MHTPTANSRERQHLVHNLVLHSGELKTGDLARKLGISVATIRRDLAALERRGLIERSWGRARVRSPVRYEDFKAVRLSVWEARQERARTRRNPWVEFGRVRATPLANN